MISSTSRAASSASTIHTHQRGTWTAPQKLSVRAGVLEGSASADLGRGHLLPDAVFVFQIDIQLAGLPIGAEAVVFRAVVQQAERYR